MSKIPFCCFFILYQFTFCYISYHINNRLLLTQDPLISSSRQIKKPTRKAFLPETIEILMSAEPNRESMEEGSQRVKYLPRKVAMKLNQTQILTRNDDGTYTYQFISPMANTIITFTSGEEFEEVKADGTKVKAVISIVDNIMIHIQTDDNGKISQHIREFYPDKMTVTTTVEGLNKIVKRHYVVEQLPTEGTLKPSMNGDSLASMTA